MKSRPMSTVWSSVSSARDVVATKVTRGSSPAFTVVPSGMMPPLPPPPDNGTKLEANAAVTPGRASTRRTTSLTRVVIASGVA